MAKILTGDKMIKSVRQRTMCPDDTSIFTDDDILDLIDEEMTSQVLDKLTKLHGENLTISVDIPRNNNGTYTIPHRALGNKLRDVSIVQNNNVYEMSQIGIGELPDYSGYNQTTYQRDIFYVENNKVKIVNNQIGYDSIRMRYMLRPNTLTKVEKAGVISAITADENAGTVVLDLSQAGKNFTSGDLYDIVGKKTPNKIRKFDLTPTDYTKLTNSASITFAYSDLEDILEDLEVGDYVTIAEETPVPNIPTEMHPLLAQAAAVQILESLTDTEALQNAERRLDKIVAAVQELIDDRVELAPKKIKPRNGALQSQIGRRFNRRGR